MLEEVVEVLTKIHQIHQEQVVVQVVVEQVQVDHHQETEYQARQEQAVVVAVVDISAHHQEIMVVEQAALVL
jgi:hypothetical protein